MKVVFARHCETDHNAQGRIQGQMDTLLNANGIAQAYRLASGVTGCGINRIVSSDLTRAVQTASIVMRHLLVPILLDNRWRECSFGSLDGTTFAEFGLRCGLHNLGIADPLSNDFTPFGGELGLKVFERQKESLDELKVRHDRQTVMIVGHGRSLRTLLKTLGHPTKFLRAQGTFLTVDY